MNSDDPESEEKRYLTEHEAAELTRLSTRTLQRLRQNGKGPSFIRLSARRLVYDRSDLESWLKSHMVGDM
ncbi:helix-turn-helix transcriptional regulator [Azospirillum brasilense]|uniref:helix-turn-helix transcriptional regulator n=1 Tax=Azospirillum brasilense TaxID=192 RepID=UPI003AF5D325|nr:helix-turn-helix domain-containing protein [Azospirillum brasilense]